MKRAALYVRVSSQEQHTDMQYYDLRRFAEQRGFEIVHEYSDRTSGARSSRPGLDAMLAAARKREFDVLLVWASDRLARSVRHFLEVLDELNHLGVEFVSFREQLDTGGPLGRAVIVIVGAIAELERSVIRERVRAGMRRAKMEGQHIGRRRANVDRLSLFERRRQGWSLGMLAQSYQISRTTVARIVQEEYAALNAATKGGVQLRLEGIETTDSAKAA